MPKSIIADTLDLILYTKRKVFGSEHISLISFIKNEPKCIKQLKSYIFFLEKISNLLN